MKPGSATFKQAKEILQHTFIKYAERLELFLTDENDVHMHAEEADWAIDHDNRIWYVTDRASLLDRFAEGIAELLDNSQLIYQIKAAVNTHHGLGENREERVAILQNIMGIDREQLKLIELHLNDELTLIRDNLVPSLLACGERVIDLSAYDTIDDLKSGLFQLFDREFIKSMLTASSKASDYDRGLHLYEQHNVSLLAWNAALSHPDVRRKPVINQALKMQFQERKSRIRSKVLAVVREQACITDDCEWYIIALNNFAAWSLPESWTIEDWTICDERFEEESYSWLANQGLNDVVIVEATESPEEISRINYNTWKTIAATALQVGRLLEKRGEIAFPFYDTDKLLEAVLPNAVIRFQWRTYDEAGMLRLISPLFPPVDMDTATIGEWTAFYGCMSDELDLERETYKEQKKREREEKARENRMLDIMGTSIEVNDENMYSLWDILQPLKQILTVGGSPDAPLGNLKDKVSEDYSTNPGLDGGTPGGYSGGGGNGGMGIVKDRPTQEQDRAIGLAGELWMNHWIKTHLPETCDSSWVSGNRRYFFKGEQLLDDTLGYDFQIYLGGKEIQIEVKATRGTNEFLRLGSTQTQAAREALKREKNGEPVQFVIAFITEVLTNPRIGFLPNPYSMEGALFYTFPKSDSLNLSFSLKNKGVDLTPGRS